MKLDVGKSKAIAEISESILLLCLVIAIINPDGVGVLNPGVSSIIWGYCQYVAGAICGFLFLVHFFRKRKVTWVGCFILIFLLLTLLFTFLKGASLHSWYINYSNAMFMCFLFETYQEKLPKLIKTVLLYLTVLLCVNFICMILYPNGMYKTVTLNYTLNWFLGYKSSLQYYVLPALVLGWIDSHYSGHNIKFGILLFICIVETIISQNMMMLLCLVLMIIIYVLRLYKRNKIFNGGTYVSIGVLINLSIVFFSTVIAQSDWGKRFFDFIGKDGNLSGRANIIWPRAFIYIKENLWFGYGVLSSERHVNMLGMPAAIHAHNQILEIILTGGLVLLIVFFIILIVSGVKMMKYRNLVVTQILGLSVFIILVMVSFEVFTRGCGAGIWLIFLLAGVSKQVDTQYTLKYEKKKKFLKKLKFTWG